MPWEDALRTTGVGFAFTVPVPLPNFGHRIAIRGRCGPLEVMTLVQQVSVKSPGIGPTTIEGAGLSYHERDRFGIFSRSAFQLRFSVSLGEFQQTGLIEPAHITYEAGRPMALLQPAEAGRAVCATAVNSFVDLHTIAFGTAWLPRITTDDLFDLYIVNWENPDSPQVLTISAGIGTKQTFIFRPDGYPGDDPSRVQTLLGQLPLQLWEELLVTARRDLVTGDMRSGMMHACLGFEAFVRHLLTLNAPDIDLGRSTLNDLCTRPEHLSSLIGYGLESSECDADLRAAYRRIATLRNQLLHKGALAYEWTSDGRQVRVSIETPQDGWDHLKLSLDLTDSVGALVEAKGHASGLRGVHRCEWNRRLG